MVLHDSVGISKIVRLDLNLVSFHYANLTQACRFISFSTLHGPPSRWPIDIIIMIKQTTMVCVD